MMDWNPSDCMMVLDANLDSVTQQLMHSNPKLSKIKRQLHWCLCAVRQLTGRYIALQNYTLTRCQNKDELPTFKRRGLPRSPARTDWHRYKRKERARKSQQKLWRYWE